MTTHVILEDDPDVIAAAEDTVLSVALIGGIAEEDAGGDLLDLVELHLRQIVRRLGTQWVRQREAEDEEAREETSASQDSPGEGDS